MKLAIDVLSTIKIVNGTATYTGGTNYVKGILQALTMLDGISTHTFILIVPERFIPNDEDKGLFFNAAFKLRYTTGLLSMDYDDLEVLFFPQVNGRLLKQIPAIKRKNRALKIYATLHDRQHNFYRFDRYDRYYARSYRKAGIIQLFEYYGKRLIFDLIYRYCIRSIDHILTVSNHSMQLLMDDQVKDIKFFIQIDTVKRFIGNVKRKDPYILFVGGGRPEKNLLRTLEAFCKYKKKQKTEEKMVVTGVSDGLVEAFLDSKKLDEEIIRSSVEFMPYVSYQELADLYAGCRYTVFTSKGEGYGLPVREALRYGKTVLASRTTSVPEVAGAILHYVDPFNIDSIVSGFVFFSKDINLERYESYAKERAAMMDTLAEQDMKILLDDLLSI